MASYYMAIDIGTKNGRQMIGYIENGRLQMEEVHRFDNRIISKGGEHYWDIEHLYEEIIVGLKKCWDIEKLPVLIGIGTWGSDFVLLDQENKPIRKAVAYGDERPSTIDQLKAIKEQDPECLEKAECLLFIGDYLSFLFTGVKCCEYTNANTTLLVDTDKGVWNEEIIQRHGFPRDIFIRLCPPGIMLSNLIRKVAEEIGYD
ncbi:MAG: hypothetical protein GX359_03005 [Clostridiales bacterium]|nr:hypothetical protein [Clostridiales bacterium]